MPGANRVVAVSEKKADAVHLFVSDIPPMVQCAKAVATNMGDQHRVASWRDANKNVSEHYIIHEERKLQKAFFRDICCSSIILFLALFLCSCMVALL